MSIKCKGSLIWSSLWSKKKKKRVRKKILHFGGKLRDDPSFKKTNSIYSNFTYWRIFRINSFFIDDCQHIHASKAKNIYFIIITACRGYTSTLLLHSRNVLSELHAGFSVTLFFMHNQGVLSTHISMKMKLFSLNYINMFRCLEMWNVVVLMIQMTL